MNTTALAELRNRAQVCADRCAQLKAALDRRDYDTAYSLAGDVSTLVQLAADAAERVAGHHTPLAFGSLFAGVGGFDLGFEQAGMRCAWQVEKDAAARAVLARHWPDVPRYDDVRDVGAHNLAPVDVICGGFPCQDLSVAGRRAGFGGERSVLFYEMARITDELRPALLVWENVPGLLSSRGGRDFLAVLTELDRIGYSGCWTTLDAQFFGVAQRRQRVFGVFARRDIGAERAAEILSLAARLPWNTPARRAAGEDVASGITTSAGHHSRSSPRGDGSDNLITGTLNAGAHPGSYNGQDAASGLLIPFDTTQITSATNRSRPAPGAPCHPLSSSAHAPAIALMVYGGNNTSGERGGDAALTSHGSGRYDFESENLVAFNFKGSYQAIGEDIAPTLTHGEKSTGGTSRDAARTAQGVRRLTPRECERLQGFPDDWTADQTDSSRYRQLGNAVCRNVAAWIGRRIVEVLRAA